MYTKKNLLILILAVLLAGGVLAGYQFITTRPEKTITKTNSAIQQNEPIMSGSEELGGLRMEGAETIDIQNGSLNDNGLQTIFLAKNITGEQVNSAIAERIKNPQQKENQQTLSIKQATINSQGDKIIIHNGINLKSYIIENDSEITQSGTDLIVQPNHPIQGTTNTFLIIKNTNPTNYTVANNEDRFSPGIFMIPKNEYTILKITRSNSIQNGQLVYEKVVGKNQKQYLISPTTAIVSNYAYNAYNRDSSVTWNSTNLPANTKFTFKSDYADPLANPTAYLVTFSENEDKGKTTAFLEEVKKTTNIGIQSRLGKALGSVKKNIVQFTQLENKDGSFAFQTTKDPIQGIIIVNKGFAQIFPIKTNTPFSATIKDTTYNQRNPYIKEVTATYPVDASTTKSSLVTILGSGSVEVIDSYSNNFSFSYKVQPKKTYKGDSIITSIFGDTYKIPLSIYLEKIDPKVVVEQVLSNNTVNILPTDGSFQDVLIQTKNTPKTIVEFQACTINAKIDLTKNQGKGLENNIFTCSGSGYKKEVAIKDFVYWKAYRTAVTLPAEFPKNTPAFKVTLPNAIENPNIGNNTTQYFYKSNIGILAKVAKNNVFVWGFTFADNKPITQGTITIKDLQGTQIAKQNITSTNTKITLAKDNENALRKPLLLELSNGQETAFVIVAQSSQSYYYDNYTSWKINSYLDPNDIVNTNTNIGFRGDDSIQKIYGYTDKALYKAGETIYYAGFVRDLSNFTSLGYLTGKKVSVTISDTQGTQLYNKTNIPLDAFGGFQGSAPIPTKLSLGDAIIKYTFDNNENISYSQNIKIKEYQKPTFYADITYENKDGNTNLVVKPQYYFGQPLKDYDMKVTWSLAGKNSCYYCRRENNEEYYYNVVFNDTISTGGDAALYTKQGAAALPLFSQTLLEQKGYQYTLKATVIIRDKISDETQFFNKYIDFAPIVKVGLNGQPYERLYNNGTKDTRKRYEIHGEVSDGKSNIKNLKYEVYYYSYGIQTEQGVDGSTYYLNGTEYTQIISKDLGSASKFSIKPDFIQNPGMYLVRVYAVDKNNTIIGEVQKQIDYYDSTQGNDGMLGSLPNNYALNVSIPKKTYEEGEKIPVDIEPYQKGAQVVLTVERGSRIIDTIEKTLDGSQLTLEAKKGYAPNIVVNVIEVVGTDKATGPRKEPRFFAGYTQAEVSTAMHTLNIELKTDKEVYKPGEKVTLDITTKDSKGNLVEARVSLGVIDKALLSLYDNIKEPIPYFFNKLGTSVTNFTNMKLLYQSLKAFANNGSKGGGGNGGQGMFSMIRDDLADVAFRRGGIIITGGKSTITFNLPDNLTTWTIDAIGITKDTRLGTTRKDIKATKNLIIEPNIPGFLTLGDKLELPVKVIVSPDIINKAKKVEGTAKLINEQGEDIELGKFSTEPNTKLIIPVQIPDTWVKSHFVKLIIEGSFANEKDSIEQIIPLRTEGLIAKDSMGFINTAGEHTFTIPSFRSAQVSLSLSTLPTNLIDPIIDTNIFRADNYALTEQLASQVATLALAKQLTDKGMFTSDLLRNNTVVTQNGEKDISTLINDSIARIMKRQNADGSIKWRDDEENTSNSTSKYMLSAYVYGVLVQTRTSYAAPEQLDKTIEKLGQYLRNYRTTSDTAFLRYLTAKTQANKVLTDQEKTALEKMNPLKAPYGGILRYAIAAYQNDVDSMKKRKEYAIVPTNEDWTQTSIFINQTTALLLKTDALLKDVNSTQTERMEGLQNMIKLRNKAGNRGASNANAQALITLSHINQTNRPTKDRISCEVSVAGKKNNVTVTASGVTLTESIKDTTAITKWSCDSAIIADAMITFIPKNFEQLAGAAQHVKQMKYSIAKPNATIGETTDMIASFSTDLAGEQLGVNIYTPATFKILDTLMGQTRSSIFSQEKMPYLFDTGIPFKVSDYKCMPNHWETRYDRLFLYYDSLPPITCDISLTLLKSYNGTTTIIPMTVSEIYKGAVNGRKVITQ